jgi:hypothetical protein
VIKQKDDPEYCRDSFENFLDKHGHVRWIEAPEWRRKASGSSGSHENIDVVISGHICKSIIQRGS